MLDEGRPGESTCGRPHSWRVRLWERDYRDWHKPGAWMISLRRLSART